MKEAYFIQVIRFYTFGPIENFIKKLNVGRNYVMDYREIFRERHIRSNEKQVTAHQIGKPNQRNQPGGLQRVLKAVNKPKILIRVDPIEYSQPGQAGKVEVLLLFYILRQGGRQNILQNFRVNVTIYFLLAHYKSTRYITNQLINSIDLHFTRRPASWLGPLSATCPAFPLQLTTSSCLWGAMKGTWCRCGVHWKKTKISKCDRSIQHTRPT